ncbi:MAG: hypothetical protein ACYCXP_04740 [Leptospirillum sp.]
MTTAPIHATPSGLSVFEEGILIGVAIFLVMTAILIYRIIVFLSTLETATKELSRSSLPVLHHLSGILRDTERVTHWIESIKEGLDRSAAEHLFSIFSRVSSIGNMIQKATTIGNALKNALRAYRHPEGQQSPTNQDHKGENR